eukprot:CAMPEP_0119563008 /NCGR_PEP_ID=MMETSP1352-20130426/22213_1 /TAXON_ID=265584 /ORGANISM="Stauroneis constricta, Strain CCMP1120" /LENGTH=612 /DNA_ID=CAMNT_0007611531 /DNA_START=196 /DNA_END=2034 /DNA_ORIENTATION=-
MFPSTSSAWNSIDRLLLTLDHELSLIPAIAFLALVGYFVHIILSTVARLVAAFVRSVHRILIQFQQSSVVIKEEHGNNDDGDTDNDRRVTAAATVISILPTRRQMITVVLLLAVASDIGAQIRHAFDGHVMNQPVGQVQGASSQLTDLIVGPDSKLQQILKLVPDLVQGPSPPRLLYNRHVQFIPWMLQNEIHRQQGLPYQRLHIDVTDCHDKLSQDCSRILAQSSVAHQSPTCHKDDQHKANITTSLSHANAQTNTTREQQQCNDNAADDSATAMKETITIDVFPPFDDVDSPYNQNFNASSPVIFFNPGLRCYSQDLPGTTIVRKAYEAGFRSIVVNRRGHTPDQKLQSPRWNLFGDVDDMEQVYWHVKHKLVAPNTAMFFHGISSGTAVTVTSLSKWDRRRWEHPDQPSPSFVASVSITPGYDISRVLGRDRFLWPYNDVLLPGVKDTFVLQNEALLRQFDSDAVDSMLAATNLQDFVHAAAPFSGFGNQTMYYREINPINEVRDITTPKLVLNSIDDPCCNINNLYESSPYENHDGKSYAQMIAETKRAIVAVTKTGSHCPFLDAPRDGSFVTRDPVTGGWMLNSWADRVAVEFYRAALDVYNERRFM